MSETSKYSMHSLVETPYADPVCSMALNENILAIGTMLGRIAIFFIADKRSVLLSELSAENISGINFESDYIINVSIGDKEYIKYEFLENASGQLVLQNHTKEDMYSSEEDHYKKCETSFVLMSKERLLLVDLNNKDLDEIRSNISLVKVNYSK